MNDKLHIRTAQISDAEELLAIYKPYIENTAITFEYDVPSIEEFANRIKTTLKRYPYIVAELNGKIVGYAGMWQMFDEAHMTNIAVAAEYRCRGIATNLILCLMQTAKANGGKRMTLEVREFNHKAQRVYSALGFRYAGTRRKYYSDTGENALILWNDSIDNTLRAHADGSCSESL